MEVAPFLIEIQLGLVTHKELMGAITKTEGRSIYLVAVTQCHPMKYATNKCCHRIGGAVAQACIHHLLVMRVLQACRHIYTVAGAVGMCQYGGMY